MGLPSKGRVIRPIERRKQRPRIVINVTEPGQIIIEQGTREDQLDLPPGSTIERPKGGERTDSAQRQT